ncbi:MAG TPA: aspartate 1-decarboxylase [Planctomycetaceae bacterium]|nr:aspartate 1-decarboxylase [Planctomycetaceae bacterium]
MKRILLKSKIHRATVTQADLDYVGSVSIDPILLAAADIVEHEQIQIYDITNGNRLTTYAISGEPGEICINGAAAHLINPGDLVILATYAEYDPEEVRSHKPRIVHVDEFNGLCVPTMVTEADRHEC